MYCSKCGTQINEDSTVCSNCGAAVEPITPVPVQSTTQYNGDSNTNHTVGSSASMTEAGSAKTMGILSIVLGLFFPLCGFIFGGIALSKVKALFAAGVDDPAVGTAKVCGMVGIVIDFVQLGCLLSMFKLIVAFLEELASTGMMVGTFF